MNQQQKQISHHLNNQDLLFSALLYNEDDIKEQFYSDLNLWEIINNPISSRNLSTSVTLPQNSVSNSDVNSLNVRNLNVSSVASPQSSAISSDINNTNSNLKSVHTENMLSHAANVLGIRYEDLLTLYNTDWNSSNINIAKGTQNNALYNGNSNLIASPQSSVNSSDVKYSPFA